MSSRLGFTAYYSRNVIKWFAIGVVVYLIGYIAYVILKPYLEREPPPPPIQVRFEIISTIEFPPPDPGIDFSYKLETITGGLPPLISDRGVVFRNEQRKAGFFSFDQQAAKAKSLGFNGPQIPVSPPIYQWRRVTDLPGLLEINVATGELDLVSNWRDNNNLFLSTTRINGADAFRRVQSSFSGGKLWNDDLKNGDHSLVFFKVFKDQLLEVPAVGEADMIQVNFRRAAVKGLPVVYADPRRPPVWGLVTRVGTVLELHYRYWSLGTSESEYPLRPLEDVWNDLISGRAHIAKIGDNVPGSEVVVRDFSLAYYISNDWQPFTEPVYVIRGNKDFVAYVQAIDRSVSK